MRILVPCLVALLLFATGCSKDPGDGGRAEIQGRVMEQNYNNSTNLPYGPLFPKAEQRVYIVYGDGEYYDDDIRTGPDGRFRFPWLRKGDYRVYTMSECFGYNGCMEAVSATAQIGDRKEVVQLEDLLIRNY